MKEDINIIRRIKAGEITAFSELIDRHQSFAFTLAMNIMKNWQEAEEVTQDAFFKAYQHIHEFKGQAAFSSWLYRIVYNTAISKARLKKLSTISIDHYEYHQTNFDQAVDGVKRLEKNDRKRLLKKVITSLNPDDATIVLLYYYKNMTVDEIARVTNLTTSNVKVKLHRSRQKMYTELAKLLDKELSNIL